MDSPTTKHHCCDLCAADCKCSTLNCAYMPCTAELCECPEQCREDQEQEKRAVTASQRLIPKEKLHEFKQSIVQTSNTDCVPLYIGNDLACGLPDYVIDLVVANCQFIYGIQDLEDKCLIWNYGNQIMDIMDEVVS